MLEKILKLYVTAMHFDVRSPLPHLFGPPGCGKSTVVEQLAEMVGKKLHVINLCRVSPLELEGVQMPHGEGEEMKLRLLHATFWTQIEEGDIVLFDEALRAFPEVFNALLDILTSRQVGGYQIPRAFFIAASNTTVAYDKALEDRLLHLPVPDVRKPKGQARKAVAQIIVDVLGLNPKMVGSMEMQQVIDQEIAPMYEVLDQLGSKSSQPLSTKGASVRNLIGQVQLREVRSTSMRELLDQNNRISMSDGKPQFVVLPAGKGDHTQYEKEMQLIPREKLSRTQLLNCEINHQLIGLEAARREKGTEDDDELFIDEPPF